MIIVQARDRAGAIFARHTCELPAHALELAQRWLPSGCVIELVGVDVSELPSTPIPGAFDVAPVGRDNAD